MRRTYRCDRDEHDGAWGSLCDLESRGHYTRDMDGDETAEAATAELARRVTEVVR